MRNSIEKYLNYSKTIKNLSDASIKAKRSDLLKFYLFQKNYDDLKSAALDFIIDLNEEEYSNESIQRMISTLKNFGQYRIKFLKENDNPFLDLNLKRRGLRIVSSLNNDQIKAALNIEVNDYYSLLARTIFYFLLYTGCRLNEMIQAKEINFNFIDNRLKVLGKGRKERIVFFTLRCREKLLEYKEKRGESKEFFFLDEKGKKLDANYVSRLFSNYKKKLNFSNFHPHLFRHTFATTLVQADLDIRSIQMLLGHSSLGTTQIYTHLSLKKRIESYNKYHPYSDKNSN